VGISYHTSPVEERERLSFIPSQVVPALRQVREAIGSAVILSTCYRTELYTSLRHRQVGHQLPNLLMDLKGAKIPPSHFYMRQQEEAVRHLFRVAAGLDSPALGESQIQGQVREALALAAKAQSLDGVLSRLFHHALAVGKRVRRETELGRWASSVSRLAALAATKVLGGLGRATVLVVSAGAMGKLTARTLKGFGAGRVLVTSRTYERALTLAQAIGAAAVPMDHLKGALAQADVVITATSAPGFLIDRGLVEEVMAYRPRRPLLIVDIAVPRDVHPDVAHIPLVRLLDIDDLEEVLEVDSRHKQALGQAEAIVEEEVQRFLAWYDRLDVTPIIARLRHRAEEVTRKELERTLRRMPHLSPQDRQRVEAMATAITKKLLHHPICYLKRNAEAAAAVVELFGLDGEERQG
jgi:glutamyl-tRNA reductase